MIRPFRPRHFMAVFAALALMTVLAALSPVEARAQAGARVLERAVAATFVVESAEGAATFLGSAFVWGEGRLAVTNAHVVGDAAQVRLRDAAGRVILAEVLARDPLRDVAVLALPGVRGGLVPGAPGGLGAPVWAVGAPLGAAFSVSAGMISAAPRQVEPAVPLRLLQHDAAVNPGSSGGPLVDAQGALIGMNSRIADGSRHYVGISYAIAAPDLARIVAGLVAETLAPVPQLGLHLRAVTGQIATALDVPEAGLLIDRATPGGLAAQGGLRAGDIVLGAAGVAFAAPGDLAFALEAAGEAVTLDLWRDGARLSLRVALTRPAPALAMRGGKDAGAQRHAGYSLAALGLDVAADGRVRKITENSPALLAGMIPGDRILALNGAPATVALLAAARVDAPAVIRLDRAGSGTQHVILDPWDKGEGLRRVGGANVLDPAILLF